MEFKNIIQKAMGIMKNRLIKVTGIYARHCQCSMVISTDDDNAQPSQYLIALALAAIRKTQEVTLVDISTRMKKPPYWPDIWPGEHYRLLAGLILELKPKLVIEIGTGAGLSALSMKKYLSQESRIVTFDLIKWRANENSYLREDDFADGRLIQYIDNLAQYTAFSKHAKLLKEADMILIDAPKDRVTEQKIWDNFKTISFNNKPVVIFDDIRVWNMLRFWRGISSPKMDLTSFGHWSGTGLVELK